MVGGVGYSAPISKTMIPLPEQNVSGSRETVTTSAWRLATQNPEGVVAGQRRLGPEPGVEGKGIAGVEVRVEERR